MKFVESASERYSVKDVFRGLKTILLPLLYTLNLGASGGPINARLLTNIEAVFRGEAFGFALESIENILTLVFL